MSVPVLTYHSWRFDGCEYSTNDHVALERDLRTIFECGLRIISLEQIADALMMDRLDELENCVGLSFDDGFRLDVEDMVTAKGARCRSFLSTLAEAARTNFVHATSFVIVSGETQVSSDAGPPGRPDGQVVERWHKAERSGLIKIESRGWRHEQAPVDDFQSASAHVERSTRFLNSVLGHGYCRLYAYPDGGAVPFLYDEYFPGRQAQHGVKAAFLNNPEPVSRGVNRWLLPRFVSGRDWRSTEELRALFKDCR